MDKIVTLLDSLNDNLSCPIGTEEEPTRDLVALFPCEHFVSLRAWRQYESKNPGRKLPCPMCNGEVEKVGKPLPMGRIAEILKEVKGECETLKGLVVWNRDVRSSFQSEKSRDLLDNLNQSPAPPASVYTDGDQRNDSYRESTSTPQNWPLPAAVQEQPVLKIKTESVTSPTSTSRSPWMEDWSLNSADAWATEAEKRDWSRSLDGSPTTTHIVDRNQNFSGSHLDIASNALEAVSEDVDDTRSITSESIYSQDAAEPVYPSQPIGSGRSSSISLISPSMQLSSDTSSIKSNNTATLSIRADFGYNSSYPLPNKGNHRLYRILFSMSPHRNLRRCRLKHQQNQILRQYRPDHQGK